MASIKEAHSELYQLFKMELLWKCLIWYYEYTLESEYTLWLKYAMVLNLAWMDKVLNVRKDALE